MSGVTLDHIIMSSVALACVLLLTLWPLLLIPTASQRTSAPRISLPAVRPLTTLPPPRHRNAQQRRLIQQQQQQQHPEKIHLQTLHVDETLLKTSKYEYEKDKIRDDMRLHMSTLLYEAAQNASSVHYNSTQLLERHLPLSFEYAVVKSSSPKGLRESVCQFFNLHDPNATKPGGVTVANSFLLVSDDGELRRRDRDRSLEFLMHHSSVLGVPMFTWLADHVGEFEMEEETLALRLEPLQWHLAHAFVDFMQTYQWNMVALVISKRIPGYKTISKELRKVQQERSHQDHPKYFEFQINREILFDGFQRNEIYQELNANWTKKSEVYLDILNELLLSGDRVILFHGNINELSAILKVAYEAKGTEAMRLRRLFHRDYVWICSASLQLPIQASGERLKSVSPDNRKITDLVGAGFLKVPGMFAFVIMNDADTYRDKSQLARRFWLKSQLKMRDQLAEEGLNASQILDRLQPWKLCQNPEPRWKKGEMLTRIIKGMTLKEADEYIGFLPNGAINTTTMYIFNSKVEDEAMTWVKVGTWSMSSRHGKKKSRLVIDGVTWPGSSNQPPKGRPNKFKLKIATLKERPFVIYKMPESGGSCESNAIPCRVNRSSIDTPASNSNNNDGSPEGSNTSKFKPPYQSAFNTLFNITSRETTPDVSDDGTMMACCTGLTMDLLLELMKDLNFEAELFEVPDQKWGGWTPNGWNGLVRLLMDGNVSMVITTLKITPNRSSVVDFSVPFQETGISILVALREGAISPTAFLEPYNLVVWTMTLVFMLHSVSVVVFLFEWLQERARTCVLEPYDYLSWLLILVFSVHATSGAVFIYEWLSPHGLDRGNVVHREHRFSLFRSLWLIWSMLFGAAVNADNPRGVASRFLASIWALFALVFLASYTANLAAFMIAKEEYYKLEGINDWRLTHPLQHQPNFRFATVPSGATEENIKNNYPSMAGYMSHFNKSTVDEGVKALKAGELDAFLYDANVLEFNAAHDEGCKLRTVGNLYAMTGYGVAFPRGSRWLSKVNKMILDYQKNGKLQRWKKYWLTGACKKEDKLGNTNKTLGVKNFISAFILLVGGMLVCSLLLLMEHAFYRYMRPKVREWDTYGCCGLVSISMGQLLSFEQSVNQTVDLVKKHKCDNPICETQLWRARHEVDLLHSRIRSLETALFRKQALLDRCLQEHSRSKKPLALPSLSPSKQVDWGETKGTFSLTSSPRNQPSQSPPEYQSPGHPLTLVTYEKSPERRRPVPLQAAATVIPTLNRPAVMSNAMPPPVYQSEQSQDLTDLCHLPHSPKHSGSASKSRTWTTQPEIADDVISTPMQPMDCGFQLRNNRFSGDQSEYKPPVQSNSIHSATSNETTRSTRPTAFRSVSNHIDKPTVPDLPSNSAFVALPLKKKSAKNNHSTAARLRANQTTSKGDMEPMVKESCL